LLKAADQKRQLCLEGCAAFAFVERFQKWIVFRLDNPLRGQALSENPRQCALPNAYGTFNRNVTGKLEKLGHGLLDYRLSSETAQQNISLRLRTQLWIVERSEGRGQIAEVKTNASWFWLLTSAI
jgi:hypothetical protein